MVKTLKNSFVGVLAAVFVFAAFATPAKAQTVAELQAMVNQLMAQIAAMSGGSTTTGANCYVHSATLRVGSTGSQVMALQKALGISADGKFGPMTASAVRSFQSSKGLGADGVVGPMTGAAIASACTPSTSTGGNTGGSTGSTTLNGGAGDITITSTSTDVENEVKEGAEENIWGAKVEADGSDINIMSIKLTFMNSGTSSSENVNKYIDEVKVYLNGEEVGAEDMSDFSKDSGNPDEFSTTISLDGAIVREDEEERLYVAVVANDNIDSEDMDDAQMGIEINALRFADATGVILTADVTDFDTTGENDEFTFVDSTSDDDLSLKSSSSNPDDTTITVDEDDSTEDVLALVARLDNDEDSSDMTIYDIPVVITIGNGGTDADTVEDVVEKVVLEIDGDEYEGDLNGAGTLSAGGTGTATYNFDIDGDTTVDAGDTVDVKVYLTFKDQDGNYQTSTTVQALITNEGVEAENEEGDEVTGADVNGTDQTGALLTLDTAGASVSITDKSVQGNSTDSDDAFEEGVFSFEVKVEADGNDDLTFDFDAMDYDLLGGAGTVAFTVDLEDDNDATDNGSNSYTIAEGESAIFYVDFTVDAASTTSYRVRINTIAGQEVNSNNVAGPLTISAS